MAIRLLTQLVLIQHQAMPSRFTMTCWLREGARDKGKKCTIRKSKFLRGRRSALRSSTLARVRVSLTSMSLGDEDKAFGLDTTSSDFVEDGFVQFWYCHHWTYYVSFRSYCVLHLHIIWKKWKNYHYNLFEYTLYNMVLKIVYSDFMEYVIHMISWISWILLCRHRWCAHLLIPL